MHNPTFKSLEQIFSIRREATVTKLDSIGPISSSGAYVHSARQGPLQNDNTYPNETLAALVEEAKTVLAKLEKALNSVIPNTPPFPFPPLVRGRNNVIDGVFDGKQMVADDGTLYPVPENYASKSKLVEGDLLQRAATPDGRAYFKQVSRVTRETITARLERIDSESGIAAGSNGKTYSLLHAPLRFFRVTPGDLLTLEVPVDGGCWAAVVGKTETCYTDAQRHPERGPMSIGPSRRISSYVRPVPHA